jgi:hypothetical protein
MLYAVPRSAETFTDRFNRLTSNLETHELIGILRVDQKIVGRLKTGTQKMLKLDQGLRLARHLGVSPYELMGEADPLIQHADIKPDNILTQPAADAGETEPLARQVAAAVTRALRPIEARLRRLEDAKEQPARSRRAS